MCNFVYIKSSVHCLIELKLTKNNIFSMIIIRVVILLRLQTQQMAMGIIEEINKIVNKHKT